MILDVFAKGVEKDYKKALQYFLPLIEKGHTDASSTPGIMYENGYGVEKDTDLDSLATFGLWEEG